MITREIAVRSQYRDVYEHITEKNADGTPARARVNGKCRKWKTRPTEFSLPMKHGFRTCFYITQKNACDWTWPSGKEVAT